MTNLPNGINTSTLTATTVNTTNLAVTTIAANVVNATNFNGTTIVGTTVNGTNINATKIISTTVNATNFNGTTIIGTTVNATNMTVTTINANTAVINTTHTALIQTNAADLTVNCGSAKTLTLSTVVYDDIPTSFQTAKTPAANAPTWGAFTGVVNAFSFAVNDSLQVTQEVFHKYKEGTDLEVHIHWSTGGSDTNARAVKWQVDYSIHNGSYTNGVGGAYTNAANISAETNIPANTPVRSGFFTSVGTINGSGLKIGSIISAVVTRIAANGVAPTNNPYGQMLGIHYQIDTLGSRQIATK